MVETVEVAALPLAPRNPLPYLQQMKAARSFHTGCEALRDAGGRVEIFSRPVDGVVQATSVSVDPPGSAGVMSTGRSSSLPLWNTAPARTSATRCGALTARQRVCAASISL